jgi:hypothetical protein
MKKLIALAATMAMLLVAAAPAMASTHPTMVHTDSVMIMTGGGETMHETVADGPRPRRLVGRHKRLVARCTHLGSSKLLLMTFG